MTKAKEKLVERIVIGPKPIHAHDPETGARIVAQIGDTVFLPARSAKAFARYLKDPKVAAAEAAVTAAEAEAEASEPEAEAPEPSPKEAPSESEGGDSDES
jgi:hypothetical protein